MSTIALPAQRAAATVELRRVLATTAATFAGAGGVIHLAQIPAHIDVPVVAAGFSLMVVAQSIFAFLTIIRPSAKLVLIGGWLHAVIAAIWLLSRTSGLAFIPGAEARQPVGLADLIANTFSVGVVALALVANAATHRRRRRRATTPCCAGVARDHPRCRTGCNCSRNAHRPQSPFARDRSPHGAHRSCEQS